jgi:gamma-glutamyl phosphate reductase
MGRVHSCGDRRLPCFACCEGDEAKYQKEWRRYAVSDKMLEERFKALCHIDEHSAPQTPDAKFTENANQLNLFGI